jgi:hypothetical protein
VIEGASIQHALLDPSAAGRRLHADARDHRHSRQSMEKMSDQKSLMMCGKGKPRKENDNPHHPIPEAVESQGEYRSEGNRKPDIKKRQETRKAEDKRHDVRVDGGTWPSR